MLKFDEFKKISTPEWKLKIQADLKGKDYDVLVTKTPENISIRPFYHFDDYKKFENISSNDTFKIVQELYFSNEKTAHSIARKSLSKGIDNFTFLANKPFDIDELTYKLDYGQLIFKLNFLDPDFFIKLYNHTRGKAQIYIQPIGHLIKTGNWYENQDKDFKKIKEIQKNIPLDYRFISVDAMRFHNAGATVTQQIAYALSQAVDYLENLGKEIANQLVFNFAIGNHYFFEIAKFKVFRYLWQLILDEYQVHSTAVIYAKPGMRNKSILDPHVNMLRTTMEMMSGVLGGADFIANTPYDYIFKKSNAFSERIARNQLIILREEAGFDKAVNSFEGSYFLENISQEMAVKSLDIFKQIEENGGLIAQLFKGKIQEKIKQKAQKEQEKFDEGKIVLVGVNKYLNEQAEIENVEIYPFQKKRSGQTLIEPVLAKRLGEEKEKEILIKKEIEV